MRIFYLFFIFLAFNACKPKFGAEKNKVIMAKTECPSKGTCDIKIYSDKKLSVEIEEVTGNLYPNILEGKNLIIEFTYDKVSPEVIADASLRESIHFEIPTDTKEMHLKNSELSKINLVFGRHCFCPVSGYFSVSIGELKLRKKGSKISFELEFEVEGVPSVLPKISETIEIE